MNENAVATKPRVIEAKNGNWYLYFSVRHPFTGKLCPVKIEKGFKKCVSIEEKRAHGRTLIKEYTTKLKRGWSPWNKDEIIYEDQIQYKNISQSFGYKRKAKGTIRVFTSIFLEFKKPSLKAKTYSSYQSKMRIFTIWLEKQNYGEYDLSAITNKIILEFFDYLINARDLDKATIKMYKIKISAFFDYMIKIKRIIQNPVYNIPSVKKKKDEAPKPIFPNDLEKLLTQISKSDPQLYLACIMQFFCAIRPGTELRLLKIKHINFWSHNILINIIDSKMQREEVINIPNQLFSLMTNTYQLQNYDKEFYVFSKNGMPGGTPLGTNNMRNRFNKFRDVLNLSKDYKYYSLKHTGASMLLDSGKFNLRELMDHLRHHDINSTYHYIRKYRGNTSEKIKNSFPNPFPNFDKSEE